MSSPYDQIEIEVNLFTTIIQEMSKIYQKLQDIKVIILEHFWYPVFHIILFLFYLLLKSIEFCTVVDFCDKSF